MFAAGALLLGGPALALLGPHSVIAIVAVSITRGVGFGLNTVVIGALVATAVPGIASSRYHLCLDQPACHRAESTP